MTNALRRYVGRRPDFSKAAGLVDDYGDSSCASGHRVERSAAAAAAAADAVMLTLPVVSDARTPIGGHQDAVTASFRRTCRRADAT